jgi:hypothetical protein
MPGTGTAAAIVGSAQNPVIAHAHPELAAAPPAADPAATPPAGDPPAADPAATPPAKPDEQPKPGEKDDKFAAKFAALQRRERAAVAKESEIKARESKLQEREAKIDAWKKNPMQFLTDNEMSVEQFLDAVADGKQITEDPVKKAEKMLADWKKEQDEKEAKRAQDDQEKQLKAARAAAAEKIKSLGDQFELINLSGNYDLVFEVIQEYFEVNKDKVQNQADAILTLEKAAEMVEAHLERDFEARFAKSKKLATKFAPKPPAPSPEDPPNADLDPDAGDPGAEELEPQGKPAAPNTLTNNMGSTGTDPDNGRPLTREESLARAAKLIRFT